MAGSDAAGSGSREVGMEPTMMVNRDMTPADVAAVTNNSRDEDCWGGGAWWIVVLFLFAFCGWGGNRGAGEQPVTEAGLCNAMNTTFSAGANPYFNGGCGCCQTAF